MNNRNKQIKRALREQIKANPMETLTETLTKEMNTTFTGDKTPKNYSANELVQATRKVLSGALAEGALQGYQMNKVLTDGTFIAQPLQERLDPFLVINETTRNLEAHLKTCSKNAKKRLYRHIRLLSKGLTTQRVNKFLTALNRLQFGTYELTHIKVSKKEQSIQSSRKTYVDLRNQTRIAYKAYKEEKGDFYKNTKV